MTCWDSPNIEPGETWSGYLANVTCHRIPDGTHAEVTILPYRGSPDRFIITEDVTYTYEKAERPFSIVFGTVIYGQTTQGVIKCRTCQIAAPEEQPPSDLLGMLTYVRDKIIEIFDNVKNTVISLADIGTVLNGARIKIDEIINGLAEVWTGLNREFDVFEIWLRDKFDEAQDRIEDKLRLYNEDIIKAISTIELPDLSQIGEEIKAEIIQLEEKLSDRILTDLLDYIEDRIFEEDEE